MIFLGDRRGIVTFLTVRWNDSLRSQGPFVATLSMIRSLASCGLLLSTQAWVFHGGPPGPLRQHPGSFKDGGIVERFARSSPDSPPPNLSGDGDAAGGASAATGPSRRRLSQWERDAAELATRQARARAEATRLPRKDVSELVRLAEQAALCGDDDGELGDDGECVVDSGPGAAGAPAGAPGPAVAVSAAQQQQQQQQAGRSGSGAPHTLQAATPPPRPSGVESNPYLAWLGRKPVVSARPPPLPPSSTAAAAVAAAGLGPAAPPQVPPFRAASDPPPRRPRVLPLNVDLLNYHARKAQVGSVGVSARSAVGGRLDVRLACWWAWWLKSGGGGIGKL